MSANYIESSQKDYTEAPEILDCSADIFHETFDLLRDPVLNFEIPEMSFVFDLDNVAIESLWPDHLCQDLNSDFCMISQTVSATPTPQPQETSSALLRWDNRHMKKTYRDSSNDDACANAKRAKLDGLIATFPPKPDAEVVVRKRKPFESSRRQMVATCRQFMACIKCRLRKASSFEFLCKDCFRRASSISLDLKLRTTQGLINIQFNNVDIIGVTTLGQLLEQHQQSLMLGTKRENSIIWPNYYYNLSLNTPMDLSILDIKPFSKFGEHYYNLKTKFLLQQLLQKAIRIKRLINHCTLASICTLSPSSLQLGCMPSWVKLQWHYIRKEIIALDAEILNKLDQLIRGAEGVNRQQLVTTRVYLWILILSYCSHMRFIFFYFWGDKSFCGLRLPRRKHIYDALIYSALYKTTSPLILDWRTEEISEMIGIDPEINQLCCDIKAEIFWYYAKRNQLYSEDKLVRTPLESSTSIRSYSEGHEEVNEDLDEDETMIEYSTSGSDSGSSNSTYLDLCEVVEQDSDSHQDFIAPVLDPIKEALVDRVMEEFWVIFNQSWDAGGKQCAGGTTCSSNGPNTSTTLSTAASLPPSQRKRQREDDEEPRDNNGNDPRKPRRSLGPSSAPNSADRFACPFRKHDARRYSMHNHRVCALSHWESIARVKEHLYRHHQIVPHCKRCWRTFKTQGQLDCHITVAAADICEVQPGYSPEGITPEHEKRLRSRKKTSPNQSDEDRWKDIYRLLFPSEEVPSPYFEPVQEEVPMSPDSRDLAGYEDYIRRELPRLVRSNIEEVVQRDMRPLEESLIGSLVGIIQDCQDRVFRAYREAQRLDEIEMPLSEDSTTSISPTHPDPTGDQMMPEQSLDSYPQRSKFLDTVFQPHLAQFPETVFPIIDRNGPLSSFEPSGSSDMMFSDSGYASELLQACNCHGPCNCIGAIRYQSQALDANNLFSLDEIGVGDMQLNNFSPNQP